MMEVDTTRFDFINSIIFSLVDVELLQCGDGFKNVDKAHEVIGKVFEDVHKIEMVKKITIQ